MKRASQTLLLLSLLSLAGFSQAADKTVKNSDKAIKKVVQPTTLSPAKDFELRVIRFPKLWSRDNGSLSTLTQPAVFDLRRAPPPENELVVTMQDAAGGRSQDLYMIPDVKGNPRAIPLHAFAETRPLNLAKNDPMFSQDPTTNTAYINNQTFKSSGDTFAQPAALASVDQRYLLLFSFKSRKPKKNSLGMTTSEPSKGVMYIDLFDMATGRSLKSYQQKYSGFQPSLLFTNARWYEKNIFMVPLDFMSQTALIGIPN